MGRIGIGLLAVAILVGVAAALLPLRPPPPAIPETGDVEIDLDAHAFPSHDPPLQDPPQPRWIAGRVEDPAGAAISGAILYVDLLPEGEEFDERTWYGPSPSGVILKPTSEDEEAPLFEAGRSGENEPFPGLPLWRSMPDGTFRIPAEGAGNRVLTVTCDGFVPRSLPAKPGDEGIRIVLRPTLTIAGRVLHVRTRLPVPDAVVRAVAVEDDDPEMGSFRPGAECVTSPDGTFLLRDLWEGEYDVVANGSVDWPREHEGSGAKRALAGASGVDIEVDARGLPLAGRVVEGETGEPYLHYLHVRLTPLNASWLRYPVPIDQRPVGGQGRFRFVGLPPGQYVVSVGGLRYGHLPALATAPAGSEDVVVTVRRGARISGRVLLPEGFDASKGSVSVAVRKSDVSVPDPLSEEPAKVLQDGSFTSGPLEPGVPCDVEAAVEGHGYARALGVLPGAADVVLRLQKGLAISGDVRGPDGTPVAWPTVYVRSVERRGSIYSAMSGPEGSFRTRELPAGRYRVYALCGSKGLAPVEPAADVEAGAANLVVRTAVGCEFRARFVLEGGGVPSVGRLTACMEAVTPQSGLIVRRSLEKDGTLCVRGLPPCRLRIRLALGADATFDDPAAGPLFGPFEVPCAEQTIKVSE